MRPWHSLPDGGRYLLLLPLYFGHCVGLCGKVLKKSNVQGVNVKLSLSFPEGCCETAAPGTAGIFVVVFFFFFPQPVFLERFLRHTEGGRQEAGEGRPHEMRQPENPLEGGFSGFCGGDDEESVSVVREQWEICLGS